MTPCVWVPLTARMPHAANACLRKCVARCCYHELPAHSLLQVFKWEERKGWDVLLSAFLEEFSSAEAVSLTLLTHPYHGDPDFAAQMHRWATEALGVPGAGTDCFSLHAVSRTQLLIHFSK